MEKNGNAKKRLATGTAIYMVGSMISKAMQMLILPIITIYLSTTDYGYYDLIITTINLITPIFTVQIVDGMFRYLFEKADESIYVTTAAFFCCISIFILGIMMLIVRLLYPSIQYSTLIYLNYILVIVFDFLQKLARAKQENRLFAVSGIINTGTMLGFQVVTLVFLKMGIKGMLF